MTAFRTLSVLSFLLLASVEAFCPNGAAAGSVTPSPSTSLHMAPRYDKSTQRWTPSSPEESAEAGYPIIRTLLRHGPKAFLVRVTQPDNYDQAVLKFMATDKVERWQAQGNMDRFFENAQDWAFERNEMQKRGMTYDYVTLDKKQIFLSTVWAGIVVWFFATFPARYL